MPKNSFVVYYNYRETLADLTDEQVGILFRAILDYEIDRKEPNFDGELKIAFRFIKKDLDINSHKYENICERNRNNGQKGGAPIGNQNARKQPKQPKQPDNDNDNDNDNEDDNDNIILNKVSKKERMCARTHARTQENNILSYDDIFKDFNVAPALKNALIEFIRHCSLNGKKVTNDKLQKIIVRLDFAHGNDELAKVESVQNAISGGYFDVIESKL